MAIPDPRQEFYGFAPVVPFERSFDAQLGLQLLPGRPGEDTARLVRAEVPVRPELLDATGLLHGGVLAAIAEALASRGTALAEFPRGMMVSGLSNDTTMTRDVTAGTVRAEARVVSEADDMWVWAIEMRDDSGEVCGFARVTIAVRPIRA